MRDDITVQEIMNREFLGVSESDSLRDAAELLVREEADCLVVLRGGDPVGCLSPRDALEAMLVGDATVDGSDSDREATVGEVMDDPAPTILANEGLTLAEDRLLSDGASRLVVMADGEAVGVLTERDVLATRPPGARAEPAPDSQAGSTRELRSATDRVRESEAASAPDRDREGNATREATQSICEVCGTLTASLSNVNGQLVCPDCREV